METLFRYQKWGSSFSAEGDPYLKELLFWKKNIF
jgi:hypothetical protein